jgi:tetratricopeptide (TPR) repeat protein
MNLADCAKMFYDSEKYEECLLMDHQYQLDADVLFYIGLSYAKLEKPQEAIRTMNFAHALDRGHEPAMRWLAWNLSDDIERLSLLEKLSRNGKLDADDMCLMGQLYVKLNLLSEAWHWFQKALEDNEIHASSLLGLSDVNCRLAIANLRKFADCADSDIHGRLSDAWDANEVMRFMGALGKIGDTFSQKSAHA